jgi:tetratricopeptide (TPR) repeat protein
MLSRPDLFNSYIAISPSLQWDNFVLVKRAEEFLKARKDFNKTLYVTLGNEPADITAGYKQFRELLVKYPLKGFEWEAVLMEDEDHGSIVLRSHYNGLRKTWNGWVIPRDPETGAIAGGLPGLENHYKKLSQKFGYTIPPPEALVNFMGYQLMAAGRMDEAIAAFKSNVERYPASANVYDSLAEAYENSGRLDLAGANYEKAYTLGQTNSDPNTAVFKTNFDRVSAKLKTDTAAKTNGSPK